MIPSTGRLWKEDQEFKARLGYISPPFSENEGKKKKALERLPISFLLRQHGLFWILSHASQVRLTECSLTQQPVSSLSTCDLFLGSTRRPWMHPQDSTWFFSLPSLLLSQAPLKMAGTPQYVVSNPPLHPVLTLGDHIGTDCSRMHATTVGYLLCGGRVLLASNKEESCNSQGCVAYRSVLPYSNLSSGLRWTLSCLHLSPCGHLKHVFPSACQLPSRTSKSAFHP